MARCADDCIGTPCADNTNWLSDETYPSSRGLDGGPDVRNVRVNCAELKELSFLVWTGDQTSATDSCDEIAGHDGGIAVSATKACSFSCNQCGENAADSWQNPCGVGGTCINGIGVRPLY